MHDGRLALVQPGNSLTGVAEDLQHLGLRESGLQPLIHQVDHLTSCEAASGHTVRFLKERDHSTQPVPLTFAVVHKYKNLPHVPRSHRRDAGVQVTNNILVANEVFLQEHTDGRVSKLQSPVGRMVRNLEEAN